MRSTKETIENAVTLSFLGTGPNHWHKDFPVAKEGVRQSPINIETDVTDKDDGLMERPLKWTYSPVKLLHIENTGHSWTVTVSGGDSSKYNFLVSNCG